MLPHSHTVSKKLQRAELLTQTDTEDTSSGQL